MTSRYYRPGPERGERVRDLFGRIAARYDLINDLQSFGLHRWWKRRLVSEARLSGRQTVLDVCCGTGDVALRLAPGAQRVIGIDFTPEMLAEAKRRGPETVTWIQGDGLRLPFGSEAFDVVTIAYGLRNLADLTGGVDELLRVLKPGGRLLILDFGKPKHAGLRWVYFSYLRIAVPIFGRVFCQDTAAYSYILDSLINYPAQDGVTSLLEKQCSSVRVKNFAGGAMSLHTAVK